MYTQIKHTDTTIDRNTQVYYINRDRDIEDTDMQRDKRQKQKGRLRHTYTHA